MKVFYALAATFFSFVAALAASAVTPNPSWPIVVAVATMGGFICYAILSLKE